METMHAAGRRNLPPVPRVAGGGAPAAPVDEPATDNRTERFVVDLTTGEQQVVGTAATTDDAASAGPGAELPDPPELAAPELDAAQLFVARLRAAAPDFAEAAGASSAVVREAVPPARHRRARCRLVLCYADAAEVDVTFLGAAGRPGSPSRHGFDRQIRRWLAAGQRREDAWLVADPEAPDGLAVDLTAWTTAA